MKHLTKIFAFKVWRKPLSEYNIQNKPKNDILFPLEKLPKLRKIDQKLHDFFLQTSKKLQ